MDEELHQVAPMRLIGLRGQPHLHRADHAPVHLRHRENDASLAYAADNIPPIGLAVLRPERQHETQRCAAIDAIGEDLAKVGHRLAGFIGAKNSRSEEHTSELQSLMRNSYAV